MSHPFYNWDDNTRTDAVRVSLFSFSTPVPLAVLARTLTGGSWAFASNAACGNGSASSFSAVASTSR